MLHYTHEKNLSSEYTVVMFYSTCTFHYKFKTQRQENWCITVYSTLIYISTSYIRSQQNILPTVLGTQALAQTLYTIYLMLISILQKLRDKMYTVILSSE
jgi:hypothetical protein